MDMQNVSNLAIPEGTVRTIHDEDNRLIWGRLAYDTKYAGDTLQNGTPAPDTPIAIQTVTGEQTVAVTGKNLLLPYQFSGSLVANAMTFTMLPNGSILVNGTASANTWLEFCGGFKSPTSVKTSPLVALEHGVTYSFSSTVSAGSVSGSVLVYIQKDYPNSETSVQLGRSKQITDASGLYRAWLRIGSGAIFNNAIIQTQFELGASATDYEMPQSQNYPISLDGLELCKIDGYQDYIYRSGGDWYIHKEVGSFDLSTGTYVATTSSIRGLTNAPNIKYVPNNQTIGSAMASGYRLRQGQGLGTAGVGWFAVDTSRVNFNTGSSTNPVGTLYYELATPTDTQITDAILVGQLNAVHEWLTRYGYNATVTGNLPIIINKTNL